MSIEKFSLNTDCSFGEKKRLVIVLGMHRSGTSAITRGLQALTVELGKTLIPGIPENNAKGFWEDWEVNELNNEILSHLGCNWHSLSLLPSDLFKPPSLAAFRLRALELLRQKINSDTPLGLKDPRISRLLAFWQPLFEHEGYDVGYIIAVRNPLSVAESLRKRDGFESEKSYFLWLEHQLAAVLGTVGQTRVVVEYDRLMADPGFELFRIAKALSLPDPEATALADYQNDFLEEGLRHTKYEGRDLYFDPTVPATVITAYESLCEAALATPDDSLEQLTEIFSLLAQEVERFAPGLSYMERQSLKADQLHETLGKLNEHVEYLEQAASTQLDRITAQQGELDTLDQVAREQGDRIVSLNQAMTDRSVQIISLNESLAECNEQLAERDEWIIGLNESLAECNEQLAERDEQIIGLNAKLNEQQRLVHAYAQGVLDAKRELQQVLASASWTFTKPLRFLRRELFDAPIRLVRKLLSDMSRTVWHILPFSKESKVRFKHALFARYPSLFGWSQAYRSWYGMNASEIEVVVGGASSAPPAVLENQPDSDQYVPLLRGGAPGNLPVRLIAFYLPQFHAFAENNEWWGEGFTEWTNVRPAQPQFVGHYQPHVPGELGYYNLLDRDVQQRQIELAKLYGVGGFCFYYYWFGGKRLLEQPIENYLADASLDHPFCLCWANENWTRRWDGLDSQILIAQQHSPEDDLAFAADVARYLRDPRYIRIDGKPLLIIYRPSLLPSALETSTRWREWFREQGIGEIYLAYTQSFEAVDPTKYGFDAAIEFPPNNSAPPNITSEVQPLQSTFSGTVYDWSVFPQRAQQYKKSPYRLFRSVCPSWDNTARRKSGGTIFHNSSPAAYQQWLENAIADTCQHTASPDERMVFVNAWNEWAEGAHLEPDQKYGYAWLDATRKAMTGEASGQRRERIVVVSHDAHPHGAQFLALGMVRSLANDLKFEVHTVLLGDGRLKTQFAQYSAVHELLPGADLATRATQLARQLVDAGVRHAMVNTTVSGLFAKALTEQGITCVSLIHEMPGVIQSNNLGEHARSIAASAHRVVFPARIVEEGFESFASVHPEQRAIRPQGLWRRNLCRFRKDQVRAEVRSRLGVAHNAPLILAVGYADRRKGIDLFVHAALTVLAHKPDTLFIWIGHWDEELRREVDILIKGRTESFRFLGYEPDTASYHAAADVYALASREDPFPNVVLESFDAGVPVVAFAETGGGAQLVSRVGGRVVPAGDTLAFGQAILELLEQPDSARELGEEASALVDREYAFRSYLFDLCGYAGIQLPKISVVVPSYNYARYIRQRLDSIVQQTLPIYELIILDDASTDDSVEEISHWLAENNVECRLVVNQHNTGCVFDQWAKGIALASGDFVWIAEADDLSSPAFLETVLAPMERDPQVSLSYCESQQIDGRGQRLSENYHAYLVDICDQRWKVPYIANGVDEIVRHLAIKNTIPNVSGVLFRRESLSRTFTEHLDAIRALSKAGDWLAYVKTLQEGKIAFSPRPLNLHRRHAGSVIGGSSAAKLVDEIATVQRSVANDYRLPEEIVRQAAAYLDQLNAKFNLGKRALNR